MNKWKLVPTELTAENGMEAALIGEFHVPFPELDEHGNEHIRKVNVPWTVIKKIHKAMIAAVPTPTALAPAPVGFRFKNKDEQDDDWSWLPIRFLERNKSDDRVFELLYTTLAPEDDYVGMLEETNAALKQERDELLAALEQLERVSGQAIMRDYPDRAEARALLAKYKEKE